LPEAWQKITVAQVMAHQSGLPQLGKKLPTFEEMIASARNQPLAPAGSKQEYNNFNFAIVGKLIEKISGQTYLEYMKQAVFDPLGMTATRLDGGAQAAGFGATSTVADLAAFAGDLLCPATVSAQMHAEATTVQFPGLDGVLPGYGVQRPNDWGLGFEIRNAKSPHWTGAQNSPRSYGHFGQSGTFIWADPQAELALVVLTDRDFGEWALPVWPALSDRVLAAYNSD
jgi:CubicO group peptidase (beta-lactamase class C family)